MKMNLKCLLVGLVVNLALGLGSSRASLEVSGSVSIHATADFSAPLAPAGVWVNVGSYGRCWHPSGVAVGWRPYCDGDWVWTDCGWYWESDEPWAWACYHYGCWVIDPTYGWVWVPGVEWAPAWVEWRVGGGYIGWAPLAPRGLSISIGGPAFVFVQENRFQDRVRPSSVIVNNTTIIRNTTVINNLKSESRSIGGSTQRVMVNEGPGLAAVQKATGKAPRPVPIREAASRTHVPSSLSSGTRSSPQREIAPAADPQHKAVPSGRGEPPDFAPAGAGRDSARPSPPDRFAPAPAPPVRRETPPGESGRDGVKPPGHAPEREAPPAAPPRDGGHEHHDKD